MSLVLLRYDGNIHYYYIFRIILIGVKFYVLLKTKTKKGPYFNCQIFLTLVKNRPICNI